MSPAREVYAVRWSRAVGRWTCPQLNLWTGRADPAISSADAPSTKAELVRLLARRLARRWTHAHIASQLRVFGKHGRIQFERTYGRDPRRFKG